MDIITKGKVNDYDKIVGARITLFRKDKGIRSGSLAKGLNISQQQLRKYEHGVNRISAGSLFLISELLEKDISCFYENLNNANATEEDQKLASFLDEFLKCTKRDREIITLIMKIFKK